MLNDDAVMTQAQLERHAEDLTRRLRQLKREIKQLSQHAGGHDLSADPVMASVTSWLDSGFSAQEWVDITELYSQYRAWMDGRERPCVSMKMFGKTIRKVDGVSERLHPASRRAQLWLP